MVNYSEYKMLSKKIFWVSNNEPVLQFVFSQEKCLSDVHAYNHEYKIRD